MFHCPKSILRRIAGWIEGVESDSDGGWTFEDDHVIAGVDHPAIEMWFARKRFGQQPSGGWRETPLPLLVTMEAIEAVWNAYQIKGQRDGGLGALSKPQLDLVRWLST